MKFVRDKAIQGHISSGTSVFRASCHSTKYYTHQSSPSIRVWYNRPSGGLSLARPYDHKWFHFGRSKAQVHVREWRTKQLSTWNGVLIQKLIATYLNKKFIFFVEFERLLYHIDRLCGVVVRVSGYRSRGPEFHSRLYQIFWEVWGLERGPLSLVRTIKELFEWKNSGSGLENRD
jgi:hypothetical protein